MPRKSVKHLRLKLDGLGLPMLKLEFFDGSSWYSLATEAHVSNKNISISGDVSGSGTIGAGVSTVLSNFISKTSEQSFNLTSQNSVFNLFGNFNSGNSSVNLRLGRQLTAPLSTGLYGYEFKVCSDNSGMQRLELNNSSNWNVNNIFKVVDDGTNTFQFNSYRLTGGVNPVQPNDFSTKNYVDLKTYDINSNTSGQLNISRLQSYPNNANNVLKGNATWSKVDIRNDTTGFLDASQIPLPIGIFRNNAFYKGDGFWQYVDLANSVTGFLPISKLSGYPGNSNQFLRGDGTWQIPFLNLLGINGNVSFGSYDLNTSGTINATTGTLKANNLTSHNSSELAIQIPIKVDQKIILRTSSVTPDAFYIKNTSNFLDYAAKNTYNSTTSTLFETRDGGETCSIVMNGDYMQFINPLDTLGFIFTDEDSASYTSYVSYINAGGQYISCSKDKKHSIRKKEHKDYLQRLNKLNIYSYGLKYQINKNDHIKKKSRKQIKMNELQVGVIAEEVAEIFDNATNQYKPLDDSQKAIPSHTPSLGINYNTLLCYTILAIQELTNKVEILEQKLEKAYNL